MICLIQLPKEHGRRIYEIIQLTLRTRQEITWTTSVVNVLQVQSIFYFRNLSISLLPNSKDACSTGILALGEIWSGMIKTYLLFWTGSGEIQTHLKKVGIPYSEIKSIRGNSQEVDNQAECHFEAHQGSRKFDGNRINLLVWFVANHIWSRSSVG